MGKMFWWSWKVLDFFQ